MPKLQHEINEKKTKPDTKIVVEYLPDNVEISPLEARLMENFYIRRIFQSFYHTDSSFAPEQKDMIQELLLNTSKKEFNTEFTELSKVIQEHLIEYGFVVEQPLKENIKPQHKLVNPYWPALNSYQIKRLLGLSNTTIQNCIEFLHHPFPEKLMGPPLIQKRKGSKGKAAYFQPTIQGKNFGESFFGPTSHLKEWFEIEDKITRLQGQYKTLGKNIETISKNTYSILLTIDTTIERAKQQLISAGIPNITVKTLQDSIEIESIKSQVKGKFEGDEGTWQAISDILRELSYIIAGKTRIKSYLKAYREAETFLTTQHRALDVSLSRIQKLSQRNGALNRNNLVAAKTAYVNAFKGKFYDLIISVLKFPSNILTSEESDYLAKVLNIQAQTNQFLQGVVRLNDYLAKIPSDYLSDMREIEE